MMIFPLAMPFWFHPSNASTARLDGDAEQPSYGSTCTLSDEYEHIAGFVNCSPFDLHPLWQISHTARSVSDNVQTKRKKAAMEQMYRDHINVLETFLGSEIPQIAEARTVNDIYTEVMKEIKVNYHNVDNYWKGVTTETNVPFLVYIFTLSEHNLGGFSRYFVPERNVILTMLFDEESKTFVDYYDLQIDQLWLTNPRGKISVIEDVKPPMFIDGNGIFEASLTVATAKGRMQVLVLLGQEYYTKRLKNDYTADTCMQMSIPLIARREKSGDIENARIYPKFAAGVFAITLSYGVILLIVAVKPSEYFKTVIVLCVIVVTLTTIPFLAARH